VVASRAAALEAWLRVPPLLKNPATWFGALVPPILLVSAANNFSSFRVTSSWEAVLSAAGIGITLAAPVLAAGAAAASGSSERWRRSVGLATTRMLARRLFSSVWPLIAAGIVGYLLVTALFVSGSEPHGLVPRAGLVVLAFTSCVIVSTMIGGGIGLILPSAVAVPVSAIGSYVAVVIPLVNGEPESGNLLGYSIFTSPQSLSTQVLPMAYATPVVLAIGVVLAVVVAGIARRAVAVVLTLAVLATAFFSASAIARSIPFPPVGLRDAAELNCAGDDPTVCLWPEMLDERAATGDLARALSESAREQGIDVPATITMQIPAFPDDGFLSATSDLVWAIEPSISPDEAAVAFAFGLQRSAACVHGAIPTDTEYREADRAVFSLAIALGAAPDIVARPYRSDLVDQVAGSGPVAIYETLGLEKPSDGFAVYRHWLEEEKPCL
jgi:hypothetical protein